MEAELASEALNFSSHMARLLDQADFGTFILRQSSKRTHKHTQTTCLAFGFRDKICSNFSFGFQVVRVLRRSDSGVTSVCRMAQRRVWKVCLFHKSSAEWKTFPMQ